MTVLVTGAAGFLGRRVVELLRERGERPRAFVGPGDDATPLAEAGVEIQRGDIADRTVVEAAVEGVDRVLHCAARTGPWGPEAEYVRTNVVALERLVGAAMSAGVRRIVHVSSVTVHGNDVRGSADEDAPLREESNPYSRSKVAGERLLAHLARERDAPVTIVRPGWVYGERDHASFARLARLVSAGQMVIIGSGRNHLPLIHVTDAARGVIQAGDGMSEPGRAYLLVNDEPVTQARFLAAIADELGAPRPTRSIPYELALMLGALAEAAGRLGRRTHPPPIMRYGTQLLGGENRYVIARARAELGFAPQVRMREGVRRAVKWYRWSLEPAEATAEP